MEMKTKKAVLMSSLALSIIAFLLALILMQPNSAGYPEVPAVPTYVLFGLSAASFAVFIYEYFTATRT
ncbi:TVG0782903 [Thermoplasma volcanium GSS1]|uniref:TVG0782903 protein n=1 Tax=Thermoplasma volcanium (strain ATCC 51530 / DSM 4299 / JCM 9571 / NBRC 15438 / GSS1) TaxID=273116 RepID=Q97AN1_THEVO|nr:hypothetical protein [Thermoplasma volcanium]BAB59921.1 TVG0782903 [Thermoplasma volcanium GSS1]